MLHYFEEYVDINQMCDSTQEVKHESSKDVNNSCNGGGPIMCTLPYTTNTSIRLSTGSHPSIIDYAGPYDFEVSLAGSAYRRGSWVYSSKLKKVFIDVHKVMLIKFKLDVNFPLGLRVRALLVYTVPDHINRAVTRCTLHKFNSDPNHLAHARRELCLCKDYNLVGHVLTTDHVSAIYEYNPDSERHSVVIPLSFPQPGSDTLTVAYQFGCKTSCPGGMSRRPVNIIFTLETPNGDVVGRRSMSVKVCSCPKRDKEREENDFDEGRSSVSDNRMKRRRSVMNDSKTNLTSGYHKRIKNDVNHQDVLEDMSPHLIKVEVLEKLCTQINQLLQTFSVVCEQLHGLQQAFHSIYNLLGDAK
ncbi:cellular tumor antigen p53-like isoform X2 [Lycorma delicatula]|uniref:cellular tumor antigen p53-like isoform X2 n=1 Tax=Lycorma delicatula TaxID=130591 RepID=UPI003F516C15